MLAFYNCLIEKNNCRITTACDSYFSFSVLLSCLCKIYLLSTIPKSITPKTAIIQKSFSKFITASLVILLPRE